MLIRDSENSFKRLQSIMMTFLLALFLLSSCGTSEDSAKMPFSSSDCRGEKYEAVVKQLEQSGFTNIHLAEITDADQTTELVNYVSVDGDISYKKDDLYKCDVEVIVYYNVKTNEKKAEATDTSSSESNSSGSKKTIRTVDYEKIPYDALQQLFIDLTSNITPFQLEELVKERNLFYQKSSNGEIYQITDMELQYGAGDYNGKTSGDANQDYICVSFGDTDQSLEYYFYVNYKWHRNYSEAVYYKSGKYGDVGNVLWNEYMTTDVTGFYINEHGFRADDEENYLDTEFRSDESVPYYYRGTSVQTSLRKCASAKDAIFRTISWQEIFSKPKPSEGNGDKLYWDDIISNINENNLKADKLQDFFISLSPGMTMDSLKRRLKSNSFLYYSTYQNIFVITADSRPQNMLSTGWNGTGGSPENQDCIVVSFDNSVAGNVLYYAYYYWNEGQGDQQEAIYYKSGKFGSGTTALWNEYMYDNVCGFYLFGGLANLEGSNHLIVSFKDDAPYPYSGKYTSDLVICDSAKDAINKILLYNEAKERYIRKIITYSAE